MGGHAWGRDATWPPEREREHPVPAAVRAQPGYQQVIAYLRERTIARLLRELPEPANDDSQQDEVA